MATLNQILRTVFDLVLAPFAGLPALVGLVLVSLVTAVGMLLVFKVTSNQEKLAAYHASTTGASSVVALPSGTEG